jgi:hypothetical protein
MRSKVAVALLLLALVGCQAPRKGEALPKALAGSDPDAQVNFWHALTDQPVASNDEAFHGLLLYSDGKDECPDYADRVALLKQKKWLPAGWYEPAVDGVRRGTVAVALVKILHDKGGVTMHIVGPIPRYAVRELMFLNVYPPSTPNQSFSGNEFVGIIGRVEDYQRGNPANVPAAVMPNEMNKPEVTKQQTVTE